MGKIGFGGSRSFSSPAVVAPVVRAALASGSSVAVGCASGADQLVLSSAVSVSARRVSLFSVGGPVGGFPCGGVPSWVSAAARAGASVSWWAGGGPAVPLRARLACRSRALVRSGLSAFVLFLSPGALPSSGSLLAGAAAVLAGVPLFAFSVACPASLPGLAGSWVPSSFLGFSCWSWVVSQSSLF